MANGKYQKWIEPEGLLLIEGWARDGLTDEDIAENMGVSRATLYAWKKAHVDISDALKKGKAVVDRIVENALFKRATGTTVKTEQYKVIEYDKDTLKEMRRDYADKWLKEHKGTEEYEELSNDELWELANRKAMLEVKTYETVKYAENINELPPETTAAIFWLKNRKPKDWRDVKNIEATHEVSGSVNNPFEGMSKEDIRKVLRGDGE